MKLLLCMIFRVHVYKAIGVRERDTYANDTKVSDINDSMPVLTQSVVLQSCSTCGAVRSILVDGHWKMKHFRRPEAPPETHYETELAALRKMAGL